MMATSTTPSLTRELHERLGKVNHQPVDVASYTNKRFTVNYRVPVDQLRRLIPEPIEIDEIGDTGLSILSQCVCDFHVTRFGPVPIPKTHTNEMLCRVSVKIPKKGQWHRAYYTLRSDTSSRILGILGGYFSHFRKAISQFARRDDGSVYEIECQAKDALCNGYFIGYLDSVSKEKPTSTHFENVDAAKDFIYQLDGSCGYSYSRNKLSFQEIDYPEWDIYFCHKYDYDFALLNHLMDTYQLDAELDCVLFLEKVAQVWGSSWLYSDKKHSKSATQPAQNLAG